MRCRLRQSSGHGGAYQAFIGVVQAPIHIPGTHETIRLAPGEYRQVSAWRGIRTRSEILNELQRFWSRSSQALGNAPDSLLLLHAVSQILEGVPTGRY